MPRATDAGPAGGTVSPGRNSTPDHPLATGHGGRLTIDLAALQANYRTLEQKSAPAECAAAVKADAYGLGLRPVALALHAAGCRTFFVAHLPEAARLRGLLEQSTTIYVLNGLLPGMAPQMAANDVCPVLCSIDEIGEWRNFVTRARSGGSASPRAGIMVDTGFNRLGLSAGDMQSLAEDRSSLNGIDVALLLSQLACADEPDHDMNARQLARFKQTREVFPDIPLSLSNSGGVALGGAFRFDMVRAGISLFGGRARARGINPMKPVVKLEAGVLQVRKVATGETIGYGAAFTFTAPARVALLSIGYADGFFRSLSSSDGHSAGSVFFGDHKAPVVGRVSMDITAVDVSDVPEGLVFRGAFAEIIGPRQSASGLAANAGTIDYEVFTSLGSRYERVYSGLDAVQGASSPPASAPQSEPDD